MLVPDETTPSGRLLRLTAALAVLVTALSPIASAVEGVGKMFSNFEAYISSFSRGESEDILGESAGRAFSAEIASRVSSAFRLPPHRIKVKVTVDTSGEVPALADIRISIVAGDNTPDPEEVASFVTEQTGVKCETVILAAPSP